MLPTAALMVGDSLPRDIAGAKAMGMEWLLLLRAGAEIPPRVPPERVIRTLAEVEERLS